MTGFHHSTSPGAHGARAARHQPVPPPFADSVHRWPEAPADGRTRRWRTALNLLAVFVVGIGAGLSATWWANQPEPVAPGTVVPAAIVPVARPEVQAAAAESASAPATKPPAEPTSAPATEAAVSAARLPPGELPYDGDPGGSAVSLVPRIPYRIDPSAPPRTEASNGKADAASGNGKSSGRAAAPPAPVRPTKASARSTSPPEAQKAPAPSRRVAAPRKSDEIDRLRQQAVDELWRKRVRERY